MSAPQMPPEERFWQRYSPHNELPLSGVATLAVYLLIGLLILGGVQLSLLASPERDFSVTGGVELAYSDGDGSAALGRTPAEAVEAPRINQPTAPDASVPTVLPRPGTEEATEPTPAKPEEGDLSELANQLEKKFGKIGAGIPRFVADPKGGENPGNPGDGKQGRVENKARAERMLRWNMVFDTKNGDDYRKQLESLGAILAIPDKDGKYLVIRNLMPPVKPEAEDLQKLQRIFWVDDNAQSVRNLATALKLPDMPAHVVAFFPQVLEEQLTKLEAKFAGNRPVAGIKETRFRIMSKNGKYEPVVVDQR